MTDLTNGMEVWGRCASCERWYYCERSALDGAAVACPVCASAPSELERRTVELAG